MAQFCSNCGAQIAEGAAFCPSCGKPSAAAPANAGTTSAPASGLADNVAGLLAYLFIPAIIFLVVEPYNRNRFIRFHSFQSIFFAIAWFFVNIVFGFVLMAIPLLGWAISMLLWLGFLILWIVLMIKAFQGSWFKLPVIGDIAEKQAGS